MDFQRFKEINDKRINYREMEDATVVSSYRNIGCGDGYRIYLKIDSEERIVDASYTTTGCGFGVTALAVVTEIAKNKTVAEAEALTEEDIEKVFEFPERRKNYPESAIAALKQALQDYRKGGGIPMEKRVSGTKALQILQNKGHLREENLSSIILEKQNLDGVDFTRSNLHNAFLQNNSFVGANFEGANLRGAFLNNCDLTNANFRGADLRWAKLTGAKIDGADFSDAMYDIGTRVDSKQIAIFNVMRKVGKDLYVKEEEIS
jgi:NifU-like protein involved in Fe-S cluster formation